MRIISISDTHEQHRDIKAIPEGDVLVHSGDITMGGSIPALANFANWMGGLKFAHKILIAGNHDFSLEDTRRNIVVNIFKEVGITYLHDSGITIDGINFYGSPYQPLFHDWAFNIPRGKEIAKKWALIPDDVHVLITHGPPYGISDKTRQGTNVGCKDLLRRIEQLKQLKIHIFGHIHEGYGVVVKNGVNFVNASTCNRRYEPINEPIVSEI
jgi:Icc-related predicted phosphoesterase